MTHEDFEGIAALDAIGAATADESIALRAHLGTCIPCRRARDEYDQAVVLLVNDLAPVPPPPALRRRVLDATTADSATRRPSIWWLSIAAVLCLALWGWREISVRVLRERVILRDAEIQRLEADNTRLTQNNERLSAEIASVGAAETRTIALTGREVAPQASARVFLEPSRRRALVFFSNLPANPGDKSYQLWILAPGPQSAGVFDVTNGNASITIDNLPLATEIKGLAVTLEPKGGVQQPTNTNFYVAGNT